MIITSLMPTSICTCHPNTDAEGEGEVANVLVLQESGARRSCGCSEEATDESSKEDGSDGHEREDRQHSSQCHTVLSKNGALVEVSPMPIAILNFVEFVSCCQTFAHIQASDNCDALKSASPLFVMHCTYLV
jgi:hypothetical protein